MLLAQEVLNDTIRQPFIYGHFNALRNFGIQDYDLTGSQFATILRDPLETTTSQYFYVRKHGSSNLLYQNCQKRLEDYTKSARSNMLDHFSTEVNISNFKGIFEEVFIEIGVSENLTISLEKIAQKLDRKIRSTSLLRVNFTQRDQFLSESHRDFFIESHCLEFAIHEYAKSRLLATT